MGDWVYRVQHTDGRGPYRPGFSRQWADDDGPILPTFMQEFGDIHLKMDARDANGCAFRSIEQLLAWFTPKERKSLRLLGFSVVKMKADRIIAESDHQLVIARRLPFTIGTTIVPWSYLETLTPHSNPATSSPPEGDTAPALTPPVSPTPIESSTPPAEGSTGGADMPVTAPPGPDIPTVLDRRSIGSEEQVWHRAAVEAGYAPLPEYVEKWGK